MRPSENVSLGFILALTVTRDLQGTVTTALAGRNTQLRVCSQAEEPAGSRFVDLSFSCEQPVRHQGRRCRRAASSRNRWQQEQAEVPAGEAQNRESQIL